jgi:hypothetical protein
VPGTVAGRDGERAAMDTAFGRFEVLSRVADGEPRELFFRPHHVKLCGAERQGQLNVGKGAVVEATFLGDTRDVRVAQGEQTIRLRPHASERIRIGEDIHFEVDPRFALGFDKAPQP